MDEINLLKVCLNAFVAVLGLLSLLALTMRGLIALFPEKPSSPSNAAIAGAITLAVQHLLPGSRVTRIESLK